MTKVIGSQTNVPDVGDPITSPWYQDTAKKIVHPFTNAAARDAWVSPPNGATCVTLDTGLVWTRRNGVWTRNDWNTAWGRIAGPTGIPNTLGNGGLPGETTILTLTSVPFTDGRKVRVTYSFSFQCSVAGDFFYMRMRRGSGIAGGLLTLQTMHAPAGVSYQTPATIIGHDDMTAANGSPTAYTFSIERIAGTGNLSILGSSSSSNFMWVDDVGPVTKV